MLELSASSLNFGSLLLGESKKLVVNVTNPNTIPVAWQIQATIPVISRVCAFVPAPVCLFVCMLQCAQEHLGTVG